MRTIPLGGKIAAGRVALVDDDDYDLVMAHRWFVRQGSRAGRRDSGPYAMTNIRRGGRRTTIRMHQLITGWPQTDHENHDGLDNQRHNLRPATTAQNVANRRPWTGSTSQFKGVGWQRSERKWRARIQADGRLCFLGLFTCEEDAARAYDAAALAAFGEYAYLNFPPPFCA